MSSPREASGEDSFTIHGCEIIRTLSEGGMGKVYLASQRTLKRLVCVKVLSLPEGEEADQSRARFYREAELLASLSHPHILSIFDFGTTTDSNLPFLVTEYIEGGDLRRCMTPGQAMPIDRVRSIVLQVGEALTYMHGKGILHRDLKPENILMPTPSLVKVGDLGIAVLQEEAGILTKSLRGLGTIGYVSPEQQYGLKVDERTDQYSLAALSYELLTGRRPLGSFQDPSRWNPKLGREVDSVILRGLSEEPKGRFPDVGGFVTALDRALASSSNSARHGPRAFLAVLLALAGLAWLAVPKLHREIGHEIPNGPSDPAKTTPTPTPAAVRSPEFDKLVELRSYAIWDRMGRPTGQAGKEVEAKNWIEAERQIEDEVKTRAFRIWVEQGRPTGAAGASLSEKNMRAAEEALLKETLEEMSRHPIP